MVVEAKTAEVVIVITILFDDDLTKVVTGLKFDYCLKLLVVAQYEVSDIQQKDKIKGKTNKAEHGNGMSTKKPEPKACPSSMDQPGLT
ncbi:hypothetical protein Tco_0891111 [Tanacetum coccineum]|uniref:Uncharacterized protein n=1 Tax=Tanacetum coccineum TaxID=301880 RepID=A0ABQ5C804_9ASTR